MLRGAEYSQGYARSADGRLEKEGSAIRLEPGQIEALSPRSHAFDQVLISIRLFGANIGAVRRAVYQPNGTEKLFISGYSNAYLPNIWDLSKGDQAQ